MRYKPSKLWQGGQRQPLRKRRRFVKTPPMTPAITDLMASPAEPGPVLPKIETPSPITAAKRPKRHGAERYRGPNLVTERWTNAKAGLVGFLAGSGLNSCEIAAHLGDGTSSATIRALLRRRWELPRAEGVKVPLPTYDAHRLKEKAASHKLDRAEFCRRILSTIARDSFDLYSSITDGAYD